LPLRTRIVCFMLEYVFAPFVSVIMVQGSAESEFVTRNICRVVNRRVCQIVFEEGQIATRSIRYAKFAEISLRGLLSIKLSWCSG
jgi:hypothetical protein